MRTVLTLFVLSALLISVPSALAASVGGGIGPDITTVDYTPDVWLCGERVVYDDNTEPGRLFHNCNEPSSCELLERFNNYAFEGESVSWRVLVHDKNGIDKIADVFATVGSTQGPGNDIEADCTLVEILDSPGDIDESCNARIDQADLEDVFSGQTAAYYECQLTVETSDSMYGEFWVTVEAEDLDGLIGSMAENEYWFFNPLLALSIDGDMTFEDVLPGTDSYSPTILVGNDADDGSGVMLDMFISGTDFYDSSSSGARCPTTNQLPLSSFRYFATNGAYSTLQDLENDAVPTPITRDSDNEGYVNIEYGIGFNDPNPFYNNAEIIQAQQVGQYYTANLLAPGAEMAVTFKLSLPEPCNGDFDTGQIFFWGEAV